MSAPCPDTCQAAIALCAGLYMSRPCAHDGLPSTATLICHSPRESSPFGLCACGLPPDSARAMAVIVTAWSGENPALRAKA